MQPVDLQLTKAPQLHIRSQKLYPIELRTQPDGLQHQMLVYCLQVNTLRPETGWILTVVVGV
jgi:hypothetical protein